MFSHIYDKAEGHVPHCTDEIFKHDKHDSCSRFIKARLGLPKQIQIPLDPGPVYSHRLIFSQPFHTK